MTILLCSVYFAVLLCLSAYGLHRLHLVRLCAKHQERIAATPELAVEVPEDELPHVTVQLPLFNESTVVERLLEAVAATDYPRDRLEIQVLDDSIDETCEIAAAKVAELQERGVDAVYIHRVDRTGYKAGALDNGLKTCKGELVAIFDADFLPKADFVRSLVGHFEDEEVAMVQARWAHLNRDASLLTKVQALMLDGHHLVENRGRYGAGWFFNFSGTGGMWRKCAIHDAGGWQHDTLTEDLDLSYRAQLKGWRFVYRPDVISPAELPEDISAVRAQQHRWAKGTVQTAVKLMRRVMRSDLSVGQRIEAFFHLTPHFAYPLMMMLSLLLVPVLLSVKAADFQTMLLIDLPLCMAPMSSLAAFYMLAETAQGRSRWSALKLLPWIIALGAGLAPHLSGAVLDGWRTKAGEFVRTPKRGSNRWRYAARTELPLLEMACALLSFVSVFVAGYAGHWFAMPFATLFGVGYAYIAYLVIEEQLDRRAQASADDEARVPAAITSAAGEAAPGDLAA